MRLTVLAGLALGVALQAGAFVQKAYACEPMRRVAEEQPDCCRTAGMTRWTEEGGDCCVRLVLDEANRALRSGTAAEVAGAAGLTIASAPPALRLPAPQAVRTAAWQALERGPPLRVPTENVVLLN